MTESNQLLLELETSDQSTATALEWIARSYESMEEWKKKAREVFYCVNGNSEVTRNRVLPQPCIQWFEASIFGETRTRMDEFRKLMPCPIRRQRCVWIKQQAASLPGDIVPRQREH